MGLYVLFLHLGILLPEFLDRDIYFLNDTVKVMELLNDFGVSGKWHKSDWEFHWKQKVLEGFSGNEETIKGSYLMDNNMCPRFDKGICHGLHCRAH